MKTLFTSLLILSNLALLAQDQEPSVLIQRGQHERAADLLHERLRSNALDAASWYWLAQSYIGQEQPVKGLDSMQKASPSLAEDPLFLVAKGQLLLANGRAAEAAPLFSQALDGKNRKNVSLMAAVARAHASTRHGDHAYAIELLEKAIKKNKRNAELHILKGNAYRMMNKGSEAYLAYQDALEADPNSVEANYQLGLIFVTQKNPELYLAYFEKSLQQDPLFAPALYQMYAHYFTLDPAKAIGYYDRYAQLAGSQEENAYAYTDLLYLNKEYGKAIEKAYALLARNSDQPRLYKLLAYSYQGTGDTASALNHMKQYFQMEADSNFVEKDYETMAGLLIASDAPDSAMLYMEKMLAHMEKGEKKQAAYKKIAQLAKSVQDYPAEAKWLGAYYASSPKATNVDLFNWGLAHFRGGNYASADSVFGLYVEKYPEQGFGYYWRAKSNAAIDKEMKDGKAVPHYVKLLEVLTSGKEEANKTWLIEAYAYLAAYETNVNSNYAAAISYFEKLLEQDPANTAAKKYIGVLQDRLASAEGSK